MQNTLFSKGLNELNPGFDSKQIAPYHSYHVDGTTALKSEKLRVGCYCRVSSMSDMQEGSLENQTMYFTKLIRSNPSWHFVGVYSDRGKTGTKIEHRTGFQKMIRHALDGKIDLILCKSISRFARNVLSTIDTIRILTDSGVRVIFEKENIDTADLKSEFIITLLSAVSQEESRSISENINWSVSKRYGRGEAMFTRMLGYEKKSRYDWEIIESEANIVKEAFDLCLKGMSPAQIARAFIRNGYQKANGRSDWSGLAVRNILKNERYTGDALCQKTYTQDYLSHKSLVNTGQKSQYLISDHHEAIVDKEIFEKVQEVLMKRSKPATKGKGKRYPFSKRLICGMCGAHLQRFSCRGIVTWRCGNQTKSNNLCKMKGIREEKIIQAAMQAFYVRYQLTNGNDAISKMIKDLENTTSKMDFELNQLKLDLERVLFEENMAILKGDESSDTILDELSIKRKNIETKIKKKEQWWQLLDDDYKYREEALSLLKKISSMEKPISELKSNLMKTEFIRAWVINIKVVSPISFSIEWITGDQTNINLKGR